MKKMIHRIMCFVLAMIFMVGAAPAVNAASHHPFTDVKEGAWYEDSVIYVYENGLMNGVSEDMFAPNLNMNRAMLVTVLHRYAGAPSAAGHPFTDVKADSWYEEAVAWAYENGIVNGTSEILFSPNNNVTREQLVAISYRYAKTLGFDEVISADLSNYLDQDEIDRYAREAFQWAVSSNIVNGVDANHLNPNGNSTRAQCATIIQRLISWSENHTEDVPETLGPPYVYEPDPNKDYSAPYAFYRYPICGYDAISIEAEMSVYGESLGMTSIDLSQDSNAPDGFTVKYVTIQTSSGSSEDAQVVYERVKQIVDDAYSLMSENDPAVKYFDFRMKADYSTEGTYTAIVKYLEPIKEDPTNADGSVSIDALEQYGRDYAYLTYGYDGNPNCNPDTNAGYYPCYTVSFYTAEEAEGYIREKIDNLYQADTYYGSPITMNKDDGSIARCQLNIYIETTNKENVYKIWCYYGGLADPYHLDFWI